MAKLSNDDLYKLIKLETLSIKQWDKLIEKLIEQLIHVAQLLSNEMPDDIFKKRMEVIGLEPLPLEHNAFWGDYIKWEPIGSAEPAKIHAKNMIVMYAYQRRKKGNSNDDFAITFEYNFL